MCGGKMDKISAVLGLAVAAACAVTVRAYAGAKFQYPVSVNNSARVASGAVGDARTASDPRPYIGCVLIQSGSTSESLSGRCEATDANGNYGVCYFPQAAITGFSKVLAATGPNTYYYFQWDATGACTYLYTNNESYLTPLTP
jgi:hypothetical protein